MPINLNLTSQFYIASIKKRKFQGSIGSLVLNVILPQNSIDHRKDDKLKVKTKKKLSKIKKAKLYPKVILVLVMSLFLVSIVSSVKAAESEPSRIFILAKGDDQDIPGAKTLVIGAIEFSGEPSGYVYFQTKIYDESGEKIYTIKGILKDGAVQLIPYHYCPVRNIYWTNIWVVMGEGMVKTTDTVIENFEYRGNIITLPNTGGKYVPATIAMMVNPTGEYITPSGEGGVWEGGGWAFAGIPYTLGGVSFLKIYIEK